MTVNVSDMDMFESAVSESDASEGVVLPVNFVCMMLRTSDRDMFESAVSESDASDDVVIALVPRPVEVEFVPRPVEVALEEMMSVVVALVSIVKIPCLAFLLLRNNSLAVLILMQ